MTPHKAAPAPVGNLRQARAEQAAARKGEAAAKQRHPAGKQAPAKAAAKPEAEKLTYAATGRCGKTNTRVSTTPLSHAVDVKISGRKSPQFAAGVIVQFYASASAAQKVVDEINGGAVADWSDAKVVTVRCAEVAPGVVARGGGFWGATHRWPARPRFRRQACATAWPC
jgi:hypothetical protein